MTSLDTQESPDQEKTIIDIREFAEILGQTELDIDEVQQLVRQNENRLFLEKRRKHLAGV